MISQGRIFFSYFKKVSIIFSVLFFSSAAVLSAEPEAVKPLTEAELKEKAPKMKHDAPLEGELCVTCHMESKNADPESITPKVNNKHEVCNKCHLPDGKTVTGHCGCEDVSDPTDCKQCHTTPRMGDNPSAEEMNALCLKCH